MDVVVGSNEQQCLSSTCAVVNTHNVHFVCCNMLIYMRINDMLELLNITQVTSEEL